MSPTVRETRDLIAEALGTWDRECYPSMAKAWANRFLRQRGVLAVCEHPNRRPRLSERGQESYWDGNLYYCPDCDEDFSAIGEAARKAVESYRRE